MIKFYEIVYLLNWSNELISIGGGAFLLLALSNFWRLDILEPI